MVAHQGTVFRHRHDGDDIEAHDHFPHAMALHVGERDALVALLLGPIHRLAGKPRLMPRLVFTSANTSDSPSVAMMSASPAKHVQLRSTTS